MAVVPPDARPRRALLPGRGAVENPEGRFERLRYLEDDFDWPDLDPEAEGGGGRPEVPKTRYFRDPSRSIVATNESPDVGFDASVNPYRGCEHGCIYCYARPTHEYLGLSAGLDFESRVFVKLEAPTLLRKEIGGRRWKPRVLGMGGVTDVYQPVERRLGITRGCLEVLAEFRNPVAVVTKSTMVERDLDLLRDLARHDAAAVYVSITTLDRDLNRVMEPRAAMPGKRLDTVAALAEAGVPVGVMVAPVIPGLTDHEIPAIVEAAARAGARSVRHLMLRLPYGVASLFESWLERHFPERKAKVLGRIRAIRGGRLNDARFHQRHRGSGFFAEQIHGLFDLSCRKAGLANEHSTLSTASFRRPASEGARGAGTGQLTLFGEH